MKRKRGKREPDEVLLRVVDDTRARYLWCQGSVIGVTIARSGFKSLPTIVIPGVQKERERKKEDV